MFEMLLVCLLQANPELAAIWAVGQRIWQRDFPGIYTAIAAYQWSENILPVMEALRGNDRTHSSFWPLFLKLFRLITLPDIICLIYTTGELAKLSVSQQGAAAEPSQGCDATKQHIHLFLTRFHLACWTLS